VRSDLARVELVRAARLPDLNVGVLEEEVWVDVGRDAGVCAELLCRHERDALAAARWSLLSGEAGSEDSTHDVLQVDVDKVVERVEVLFYETFDGEESWEELPLVLIVPRQRGMSRSSCLCASMHYTTCTHAPLSSLRDLRG
jgi:hypothetical protein